MKIEKETIEKIVDGVECIEEITYRVYEDGTKEVACTFCSPKETEEPVTPETTEEELAQAEMLLMQSEILANQNAQDEVLAEILLNQMEV